MMWIRGWAHQALQADFQVTVLSIMCNFYYRVEGTKISAVMSTLVPTI